MPESHLDADGQNRQVPSGCIFSPSDVECDIPGALNALDTLSEALRAQFAACRLCKFGRDHWDREIRAQLSGKRLGALDRSLLLTLLETRPFEPRERSSLGMRTSDDRANLNRSIRKLQATGLVEATTKTIMLTSLGRVVADTFLPELESQQRIRWTSFSSKFEVAPHEVLRILAAQSLRRDFRLDVLADVLKKLEGHPPGFMS